MFLALFSLVVRGFLVCYLSFVVVQLLTFQTGLCGVRALKWYSFFESVPLVKPYFVEAELESLQFDIDGNRYSHHVWLRLELVGWFTVPFESVVGLVFSPMWEFGGLSDRDLFDPKLVSKGEVVSSLTDYQKDKL